MLFEEATDFRNSVIFQLGQIVQMISVLSYQEVYRVMN